MVVGERHVGVPRAVDRDVREVVVEALIGPARVHLAIGEGLPAVGGNRQPDGPVTRRGPCRRPARHELLGVGRPDHDLVDGVAPRARDHEVADLVLLGEERVTRIDRLTELRERRTGIRAAVHVDPERGHVVVGDADLTSADRRDPRPVIARNGRPDGVQRPARAPVSRPVVIQGEVLATDVDVEPARCPGRRCGG